MFDELKKIIKKNLWCLYQIYINSLALMEDLPALVSDLPAMVSDLPALVSDPSALVSDLTI